MNFQRLSQAQARELLADPKRPVQLVDVRDEAAYEQGHIESAVHLHGSNLQDFIASADQQQPLLVYCYHGHMSQSAAAYLAEQGFAETYSLDGGYAAWQQSEAED